MYTIIIERTHTKHSFFLLKLNRILFVWKKTAIKTNWTHQWLGMSVRDFYDVSFFFSKLFFPNAFIELSIISYSVHLIWRKRTEIINKKTVQSHWKSIEFSFCLICIWILNPYNWDIEKWKRLNMVAKKWHPNWNRMLNYWRTHKLTSWKSISIVSTFHGTMNMIFFPIFFNSHSFDYEFNHRTW